MHYVIGDVHGCFDDLQILLQKIEQKDNDATIIFVGDFIDRGTKTWEVLEWVMSHITENGKYQCVRGNHEQMIIDWYTQVCNWWERKQTTQEDIPQTPYDFPKVMEYYNCLSPEGLRPFVEFFKSMPYFKKLQIQSAYGKTVTYRIVHAWYDFGEPEDSKMQKQTNLWERNYWGNYWNDEIIVHGHTPTFIRDYLLRGAGCCDVPGMICYRPNAINVDGGCCYNVPYTMKRKVDGFDIMDIPMYPYMLCAICLETLEELYPYTFEERFFQFAEIIPEGTWGKKEVLDLRIEHFKNEYLQKREAYSKNSVRNDILKKLGNFSNSNA